MADGLIVLLSRRDMARARAHAAGFLKQLTGRGRYRDNVAQRPVSAERCGVSEVAVSKWTRVPWTGEGKHGADAVREHEAGRRDVGPIEVKAIAEPHRRLLIPPDDGGQPPDMPSTTPIILVYVNPFQRYLPRVLGWTYFGDVVRPSNWTTWLPDPAWTIQQRALRPLQRLLQLPIVQQWQGRAWP